jgi:hypothetical protein
MLLTSHVGKGSQAQLAVTTSAFCLKFVCAAFDINQPSGPQMNQFVLDGIAAIRQ